MTGDTTHTGILDVDLIIIGGGLAGASLASAMQHLLAAQAAHRSMRKTPFHIALVEAFELNDQQQPSYDDRTVALSYGSRCILQAFGLWPLIAASATAIENIHISNRGHFGVTRLSHEQEGVEALGYVVENRAIGQALYRDMHDHESGSVRLSVYCPATLEKLDQTADTVVITLDQANAGLQLRAPLLVAADGNRSSVLKLLNVGSMRQDYQQSAIVTNITPGKKHHNVAYERFTEFGPIAMLPMAQNRCSVVWTLPPERAQYLAALDDGEFTAQLQQAFGYRLGEIRRVGKRQVYPLFLQSASELVHNRVVIIGNAAHSVHPVAGQGFNLALRDIVELVEGLVSQLEQHSDIGDSIFLARYASQRMQDIRRVYRFTDALVKIFSNRISPLAHLRSAGLILVDLLPEAKHRLARYSMGLSQDNLKHSRLLRKSL